jgi:hypothetical protein
MNLHFGAGADFPRAVLPRFVSIERIRRGIVAANLPPDSVSQRRMSSPMA